MNSKKAYTITMGIFALLCISIFVTTFLSLKIISKESKKLVEIKLQNEVLDQQQKALVDAKKLANRYADLDKIARTIVPQDKDQAKVVRDIVEIARQTKADPNNPRDPGINLENISFPASSLGATAPKTSSSASGSSSSSTPSSSTSNQKETQVTPVSGIPGVYVMAINIVQDPDQPISYDQLINFLEKLENNRRTAHVSNVEIKPKRENNKYLNFSLTVNAYIKP